MTPEQIKKEIEMKELLNIPYDSAMYKLFENNNTIRISNVTLLFRKNESDLRLKVNGSEYTAYYGFEELVNTIHKDFFLTQRYLWDDSELREEFKTTLKFNDNTQYTIENNFRITEIISLLYNKLLEGKNPVLSLETIRLTPIEKRIALYKQINGNPEEIFKKVFHPEINSSRLEGRKPTSNWRSPFPSDSLKNKILMMDKQKALFTIEYLWGKKINTNAKGGEIMRTLASLPNTNFRINDLQVLKKFTDKLHQRDVKSLKSHFESCGIKPASNLRRWRKKLALTQ